MENTYAIKPNHGHYELYINGKLYCCADTYAEAEREKNDYEKEIALSQLVYNTRTCYREYGLELSESEIKRLIDYHAERITMFQEMLKKCAVREMPHTCDFCGTELEPFEADDSHVRTYICPRCARIITVRREL